jgi:acetyl-CoA C-acetyltransferase
MSENIVITGAARTPMGGFQGVLSDATASQLGATAIRAAVERSQLQGDAIDEVIMGCVLPAGQGQAPARQANVRA